MKRYIKSSDDDRSWADYNNWPRHDAIANANLTPKMLDYLVGFRRYYEAGLEHQIFNTLHAYLQGLEDAEVITEREHEDIFAEIMDID